MDELDTQLAQELKAQSEESQGQEPEAEVKETQQAQEDEQREIPKEIAQSESPPNF